MKRLSLWLVAAVFASLGAASTAARAEVRITPKHLVILRPGVDSVWGTYVFAIQNDGAEPAPFKSKVMLPKETVDFAPQEGLTPEQITLGDDGITIDAVIPNGVQIVSIGFKVDAKFGTTSLTFAPVSEVQSFSVLLPRGTPMTVQGPGLTKGDEGSTPDPQYEPYVVGEPLAPGKLLGLSVGGIPEGRTRIWFVGGAVAALLVVLAAALALRTRPRITEDEGSAVLVG
jgi:hypothetical protein